mmetsp:Transcript_36640/g.101183  ORF Transcript_36640/g.101183 Transcript_36640/m.101183 type:complete len:186 (-) Transcript_36640:22-579(-)
MYSVTLFLKTNRVVSPANSHIDLRPASTSGKSFCSSASMSNPGSSEGGRSARGDPAPVAAENDAGEGGAQHTGVARQRCGGLEKMVVAVLLAPRDIVYEALAALCTRHSHIALYHIEGVTLAFGGGSCLESSMEALLVAQHVLPLLRFRQADAVQGLADEREQECAAGGDTGERASPKREDGRRR